MTVETLERTTRDGGRDHPPVAHLSVDPDKRLALCGAPILGIKATGEYEPCRVCLAERERVRNEERRS